MIVSGFTFVRNAINLDYPVVEAIRSVLPLVDEMIVAVGKSDDSTRELIASISPEIKIIDTVWDDSKRQGGVVLAEETDKALAHVNPQSTWCIYVQADECYHEKDYDVIRKALTKYKDQLNVDGFLFNYIHFYGNYNLVGDSKTWYRKEIRIIRNNIGVKSWKDAQGFRINNRKLNVVSLPAHIHHYGWVRNPKFQMAKQLAAHKLWHDDEFIAKKFNPDEVFDYSKIDSLQLFKGSHPKVMHERIANKDWSFERDPTLKKFGVKSGLLYYIEKVTGWRIGEHKNYKIIG